MSDDEVLTSSDGLMHCLRMLADEASILRLDRTVAALLDAIETCNLEVLASHPPLTAPPGIAIH